MNQDILFQLIAADALVTKLYEQLAAVSNNDPKDGRFRGFVTQAYTLKQDLEDKLREEIVDTTPTIASAPNIPTQANSGNNGNGGNSGNNGVNPNVGPAPVVNPNQNVSPISSSNNTIPNQPQNNGDINDFFDSILNGTNNNNLDLNAILKQSNNNNNDSDDNEAPF